MPIFRVTRTRFTVAVTAVLLVGAGCVAWTFAELPPPKYCLRYGLFPASAPTGNRTTIEGVEFVEIGPGIFRLGAADGPRVPWYDPLLAVVGVGGSRRANARGRWVEFRHGFWIATSQVTVEQFQRWRPTHERSPKAKDPGDMAVEVTHIEARQYCASLTPRGNFRVRLPTEEEWECAARAGAGHRFCFGGTQEESDHHVSTRRKELGWDSRPFHANDVRLYANLWGLVGMHDDHLEWCGGLNAEGDHETWVDGIRIFFDDFGDPLRGGCRDPVTAPCRSTERRRAGRHSRQGFRPAFTVPGD